MGHSALHSLHIPFQPSEGNTCEEGMFLLTVVSTQLPFRLLEGDTCEEGKKWFLH